MADRVPATVRLRHYTRISSMERILADNRIIAADQNKVFVERADRPALSRREAEEQYLLKRGKGNAYIEFDAQSNEVHEQINRLTGKAEFFVLGDIDLSDRNPVGHQNG